MGKSKAQTIKDAISTQCGQLLADFLNKKRIDNATINLISNVRNTLNFPIPKIAQVNSEHKEIQDGRRRLRQLFTELETATNLHDVSTAHDYMAKYNFCVRPLVEIQLDGSIKDDPVLDEEKGLDIGDMLAYMVVTFLKMENSIRKIHRCIECGDYFISKKAGDHKYCPGKQCKNRYGNRRFIESGKAKSYKRDRHAEGLDQ